MAVKVAGYRLSEDDHVYPRGRFRLNPGEDRTGNGDVFYSEEEDVLIKASVPDLAEVTGFPSPHPPLEVLEMLTGVSSPYVATPREVYMERIQKDGKMGYASGREERLIEVYDGSDFVDWPALESHGAELSREEVRDVVEKMCRGLGALHDAGVVHRDVKPDNVFYNRSTGELKVADVSLAQFPYEQDTELLERSLDEGTWDLEDFPLVLPPEHRWGGHIDTSYDVWSVGAMWLVYTHDSAPLRALRRPVHRRENRSPFESPLDFPPDDRRVMAKALSPDKERRFSDCNEMVGVRG